MKVNEIVENIMVLEDYVSDKAFQQWKVAQQKLASAGADLSNIKNYNTELNYWLGRYLSSGRDNTPYYGTITAINDAIVKAYIEKATEQKRSDNLPMAPNAAGPTTPPEEDIKNTVDPDLQYRFTHPSYADIDVIIRNSGYYLSKLPKALRGKVKRDKATGLYSILRPENIKRIQGYYDAAADANKVREEPIAAL